MVLPVALDVPGALQILELRAGHQRDAAAPGGQAPGVFGVVRVEHQIRVRQAEVGIDVPVGQKAAVRRERHRHHGGQRVRARPAPRRAAPDLVGDAGDVEAEVARTRRRGQRTRHAHGDVALMVGPEAEHRRARPAGLAGQHIELMAEHAQRARARGVVVIHQPEVVGIATQRGLDADRVAVGRASVGRQVHHGDAAPPAGFEQAQVRCRVVADHHGVPHAFVVERAPQQFRAVVEPVSVGNGDQRDALVVGERHVGSLGEEPGVAGRGAWGSALTP
ncbi:hypothetical protein D3C87_1154040 [compost metagenome]